VGAIEDSLEAGWEPPPLLPCVEDGALVLHDGNHRYEALQRAGAAAPGSWCGSTTPASEPRSARVGLPAPGLG
jgi:hypothetical protein